MYLVSNTEHSSRKSIAYVSPQSDATFLAEIYIQHWTCYGSCLERVLTENYNPYWDRRYRKQKNQSIPRDAMAF